MRRTTFPIASSSRARISVIGVAGACYGVADHRDSRPERRSYHVYMQRNEREQRIAAHAHVLTGRCGESGVSAQLARRGERGRDADNAACMHAGTRRVKEMPSHIKISVLEFQKGRHRCTGEAWGAA